MGFADFFRGRKHKSPGSAAVRPHSRLAEVAERMMSDAKWSDLVLPDQGDEVLRRCIADASIRPKLFGRWRPSNAGARDKAARLLLVCGKRTDRIAVAGVVANELDIPLYRIDLSALVSKYIGETEKNLRRVLDTAEDLDVVLLFDEADALFGKRTEVEDAHDRYEDIEVADLLERAGRRSGLTIFGVARCQSLAGALRRQLHYVVEVTAVRAGGGPTNRADRRRSTEKERQ